MSIALVLLMSLVVAAAVGGALTVYLWRVRQRRAVVAAGVETLSAMRWRELVRLIVAALKLRGFEAEDLDKSLELSSHAELRLLRAGRPWLLACPPGNAERRVETNTVSELAEAVRFNNAAGGLLMTTGHFATGSAAVASGLELYDGPALWELVSPLLPESQRELLQQKTRKRIQAETAGAWGGALVLGLVLALLLPKGARDDTPAPPPVAQTAPAAAPKPATAAAPAPHADPALVAPADPNREQFERAEVIRTVSALPGVGRALWSTPSNLVVYLAEEDDPDTGVDQAKEICTVLARYDYLGTSRLQVQPPPGSHQRVRFRQCRSF